MKNHLSFRDYAIVACGTLNMELNYLKSSDFLDAKKILYTNRKNFGNAGGQGNKLNLVKIDEVFGDDE